MRDELDAARTQVSDMEDLGREMISKHNHQVELLEGMAIPDIPMFIHILGLVTIHSFS